MLWHTQGRSHDNMLRHPVDSLAWKHVDSTWQPFAKEPRNVRLGLAIDGVNPFQDLSSRWSSWPVLLVNYNLPPWLATKRFFVMMSLLIPGPNQVKEDKIDVYLKVLVEELLELWNGIPAYDVTRSMHEGRNFTLRGILLWTVHDFPTYGLLAGCRVKGYLACPICGPEGEGRWSEYLRKVVYCGHRKFLPHDHKFRKMRTAFNGEIDDRDPPLKVTTDDVFKWTEAHATWSSSHPRKKKDDPSKVTG